MKNRFSLWVIGLLFTSVFLLPAAHAQCTLATLSGPWGYFVQGAIAPQPGGAGIPEVPIGFSFGAIVADGAGHFQDTDTSVDPFQAIFGGNGTVTGAHDSGTYTVNANCTGTLIFHLSSRVVHFDFTLVNGNTQMYWTCSDQEAIVSGTATFI
jgi:hypothetical protein